MNLHVLKIEYDKYMDARRYIWFHTGSKRGLRYQQQLSVICDYRARESQWITPSTTIKSTSCISCDCHEEILNEAFVVMYNVACGEDNDLTIAIKTFRKMKHLAMREHAYNRYILACKKHSPFSESERNRIMAVYYTRDWLFEEDEITFLKRGLITYSTCAQCKSMRWRLDQIMNFIRESISWNHLDEMMAVFLVGFEKRGIGSDGGGGLCLDLIYEILRQVIDEYYLLFPLPPPHCVNGRPIGRFLYSSAPPHKSSDLPPA